ncbi:hypothetical protein, partial [Enterobacter hormaechei]|uniref:hypothetical protein n=1 Tax=Enterobacter hormaechei TaxID=158836 RepID=UPI001EED0652
SFIHSATIVLKYASSLTVGVTHILIDARAPDCASFLSTGPPPERKKRSITAAINFAAYATLTLNLPDAEKSCLLYSS